MLLSAGSTVDMCFCPQTIKGHYCYKELDILYCRCIRFLNFFNTSNNHYT